MPELCYVRSSSPNPHCMRPGGSGGCVRLGKWLEVACKRTRKRGWKPGIQRQYPFESSKSQSIFKTRQLPFETPQMISTRISVLGGRVPGYLNLVLYRLPYMKPGCLSRVV